MESSSTSAAFLATHLQPIHLHPPCGTQRCVRPVTNQVLSRGSVAAALMAAGVSPQPCRQHPRQGLALLATIAVEKSCQTPLRKAHA